MRATALIMLIMLSGLSIAAGRASTSAKWQQKLSGLVWVAYSPPTSDPNRGVEATPADISEDLAALRKAGFTGLVTYGSSGVLGRELPSLAEAQGFQGLVMGVWNPTNQEELAAARAASSRPIVVGFCIGNEGLGQRYEFAVLSNAIQRLRSETGKPVTTTEIIERYSNVKLLNLGDWVFPNAHPYFHGQLDPPAAVRWTEATYENLKTRTPRFVMFKEVGLPSAGDSQGKLSEAAQEFYYRQLAQTGVRFVYFEAFDQPWKTHLPVESHWGIFRADRTPKSSALSLNKKPETASDLATTTTAATGQPGRRRGKARRPFFIYRDAGSPDNHYKPTGYMGDIGDIHVNEAFAGRPHRGRTSIRIEYAAKGRKPNDCTYTPPCKWAGVYWQEPPDNWGREKPPTTSGFDLSTYGHLRFWARADKPVEIEFKVGGIDQPYGDSLISPRSRTVRLKQNWQEFEIDLTGADLRHIIGGFCWVTNWDANPAGATIYLDDIRFEP